MKRCFASLLLALVPQALEAGELPLLDLQQTTEYTLEIGESHRFALDLDAGDTFNVIAWQRGIDLRLRLVAPEGETIEEVDRFHSTRDREDLFRIVEVGGRYTVEVAAVDSAAGGRFRIRLDEKRLASEQDRRLMPHWRAYNEARGLQKSRRTHPESLRRAIWLYTSTLEGWRAANDNATLASTLDNLGFCHRLLGEMNTAIRWYDRALDRWRAAEKPRQEANTWINRATALGRLDRYVDSRDGFYHALDLLLEVAARTEGERRRLDSLMSRAFDGLGGAQKNLGEFVEAERNVLRALDMRREDGKLQPIAVTLNNLAAVKLRTGEIADAFELLGEARALAQTLKSDEVMAGVLSNLGVAHEWAGELFSAIDLYRMSLKLNQKLGDRRAQAEVWRNLGVAYLSLRNFEEAQLCLGRARRINQELGRTVAEANNLINLGWAFALQDRLQLALDPLLRGEEILRRSPQAGLGSGQPFLLAMVREKLGRVHAALGDIALGQQELKSAEGLAKAAKDLRRQGRIALGLGEIAEQRGQAAVASSAFVAAERFGRLAGDLWTQTDALAGRARVKRQQGWLELAQRYAEKSLDLVEKARIAAGEPLWRASLVAAHIGTYELATAIAMERHRKDPGQGHDRRAFALHLRGRGRSLLDQVTMETTAVGLGESDLWVRDLRRQINAAERAVEELPAGGGVPKLQRALVAKRDRLLVEHREAKAQLVARGETGDLHAAKPFDLEALQRRVLDGGMALLVYALGERQSYLFELTESTFTSYQLPPREVIEELAGELRGLLMAPKVRPREILTLAAHRRLEVDLERAVGRYPALAGRLGEMLLGPLWDERFAAGGGLKSLAVVVEGGLATLPFAALIPPGAEDPLIASHLVVRLWSPSVLGAMRERLQKEGDGSRRWKATKSMAIYADPVLSSGDPRLPSGGPQNPILLSQGRALQQRVSQNVPQNVPQNVVPPSPFLSAQRGAYQRLLGTGREAEAILGLFPPEVHGEDVVLHEAFAASREAFFAPALGDYRILHVATHGFVHPRHAALSGLVFSRFDPAGQELDGAVRLHDVRNLRLGAELVVLSACETGLGHELAGEGLLGLVHGFFQAGVPRVVASLWQVDDSATAELMKRFYSGVLERHEPPALALAIAQASMWKDPPSRAWRHPYYWSGFVLFGDWR
jgi:tetratricopeptide (TPR) repeat protein